MAGEGEDGLSCKLDFNLDGLIQTLKLLQTIYIHPMDRI